MLRLSQVSASPRADLSSVESLVSFIRSRRRSIARQAASEVLASRRYMRLLSRDLTFDDQWASEFLLIWVGYFNAATDEKISSPLGRASLARDAARQLNRLRRRSWGYRADNGERFEAPPTYVDVFASRELRDLCDEFDGFPSRSLWSARALSSAGSSAAPAVVSDGSDGFNSGSILDSVDPESVCSIHHVVRYAIGDNRQFSFASFGLRDDLN